jgi:prepilin-type N-terminal cleavage/methylation domain-containing protein
MKKGFTLIELLVAIGLFSVLIAIAAGAFTTALRTQRQVAALIAAQSNAGLTLEQMAREIRTGYLFCHDLLPPDGTGGPTCHVENSTTAPCVGDASQVFRCGDLVFYNGQGETVTYSRSGNALLRNGVQLTASNVVLKYMNFTIFGNIAGDHWNPRITISMGVAPVSNDVALSNNVLNLQTSVSARGIDCRPSGPNPC